MTTIIQIIINKIKEDFHGFHEDDIIEKCMKEYARIKCLEAIRNTKRKACDIVENDTSVTTTEKCVRTIQNIPNKEVMPEL